MIKGELQFIEDTRLINKLALIEFSLQKTAGIGDMLLGGLGDGLNIIKEEVFGLVDTSSTGSAIESVAELIVTGALFTIWKPLGLIYSVADQLFGIKLSTIGKKIWDMIVPTIKSKGTISPQEVTNATKSVTLAMAGSDVSLVKDVRAFDLFEPLRQADLNGKLFSFAAYGRRRSGGIMGFLSSISPFKAKTMIGGFVGWAIRAALMGAGILTVSGVGARLLGLKKSPEEEAKQKDESDETTPALFTKNKEEVEEKQVNLTSTGRGQDIHQNDHKSSQWVVPLVQNSVEKTLVVWAEDVYDELEGKELLIRKSPYFNKVVSEIKQFLEPGNSSRVPMPPKYKSRKQVVDQFAGDVENKLSEMI